MSLYFEEDFLEALTLEFGEEFTHLPLKSHTHRHHPTRLLHLQPSSDSNSSLHCTLEEINLLAHPAYKALSYVWGDSSSTLPIFVGNQTFQVTPNCHAALRRLREVGEKCIWIDAICINQRDESEKMAQIAMMPEIYSSAKEVVVWVGRKELEWTPDDEEREKLAFDLVRMMNSNPTDEESLDAFEAYVRIQIQKSPLGKDLKALSWLLTHPWFTRLWVIQEVAVAKQTLMLGQYDSIDFQYFLPVVTSLISVMIPDLDDDKNPKDADEFDKLMKACRIAVERWGLKLYYTLREDWDEIASQYGLGDDSRSSLGVLARARRSKCLDPRDRVFALLPILDEQLKRHISLNDHQTVADLYSRLAVAMMDETKQLEVLTLAGLATPRGDHSPPLPSWAVDWHSDTENHIFLRYSLYQCCPVELEQEVVSFIGWPFPCPIFVISGFEIDAVLAVHRPEGDEANYVFSGSGFELWKSHFETYPTGENPNIVWVRTLTTDLDVTELHPTRLSAQTVLQYDILSRIDREGHYEIDEVRKAFPTEGLDGDEWEIRYKEAEARYHKAIIGNLHTSERVFFITETGYMGIGPQGMREGDGICLVPGCKVPLLLRKEDGYHLLVGECFVWGVMDGEAFAVKDGEVEMSSLNLA